MTKEKSISLAEYKLHKALEDKRKEWYGTNYKNYDWYGNKIK